MLRFLAKEKGDYMANLIQEIRQFNWIKTSPLLRRMKSIYAFTYTRLHPLDPPNQILILASCVQKATTTWKSFTHQVQNDRYR